MSKPYFTQDRFSPWASQLRNEFNSRFENPLEVRGDRFVWDYWHVPGQYTHMRTPAYQFFSAALYKKFHLHLRQFGREHLGCFEITPPWLSYYVEGCEQRTHADIPHGPWAYVFSLTPWSQRKFTGGETYIFKPSTLQYWQNFSTFQGVEEPDLMSNIPALFNRLVVFDPRFPHGVRQVKGVQDPRDARLVIHGWFTDPQPYVQGPLPRQKTARILNEWLDSQQNWFAHYNDLHGTLSLRMQVTPTGRVSQARALTNTLLSLEGAPQRASRFVRQLAKATEQLHFPRAKAGSAITLPVLFR